jgi:hypothetical protein
MHVGLGPVQRRTLVFAILLITKMDLGKMDFEEAM